MRACPRHLARAWLLARLAGHLEVQRAHVDELLALSDHDLIDAIGGAQRSALTRERAAFASRPARAAADAAGLELCCRCSEVYPTALHDLTAPPAVLHVAGGIARLQAAVASPSAAVVGTRRPSPYGREVARALGRGLAVSGLTVVSGMAAGIDSLAHRGALDAGGLTIAVLAGAPERPYPASARALHRRLVADGVVVSELPPGTAVRRWMFPARNRLIAALGALTVVVEGRERSGALTTAAHAVVLGRPLGAVPGQVTSPLARGPHGLLRDGAHLIERPADVLEVLLGPDAVVDDGGPSGGGPGASGAAAGGPGARGPGARDAGEGLETPVARLLVALAEGHPISTAVLRAGLNAEQGLVALAALEVGGRIRREPGGRVTVIP